MGSGNPPDKPGAPYQFLQLSGDPETDNVAIESTGLDFVAVISPNYILLGTYDKKD